MNIYLQALVCFLLSNFFIAHLVSLEQKPFVIIITSYNNALWYEKNLSSIFDQKYDNYRIIYIDDASTDGTSELIERYIHQCKQDHRITLIKNNVWQSQMANHYKAVYLCDDNEIVVHLDGDDWLADNTVLSYLNKIYSTEDVWITYGQYKLWPSNKKGHCAAISADVIATNGFRDTPWLYSHVRTFYAGLFKQIKLQDLLMMGTFKIMSPTPDLAFMYPMLEMAGKHVKFIPKVLYVYNKKNTLSQHYSYQQILEKEIRQWPRYSPINNYIKEDTTQKLPTDSDMRYILHISGSVILTEQINIAECIDLLEQTDAYAFDFLVGESVLKHADGVLQCYCLLSDTVGAWHKDFVDYIWHEPKTVHELKFWLQEYCKPNGIALEKRNCCFANQMVLYRADDVMNSESKRKLTLFYTTPKAIVAINQ